MTATETKTVVASARAELIRLVGLASDPLATEARTVLRLTIFTLDRLTRSTLPPARAARLMGPPSGGRHDQHDQAA